MRTRWKRGGGLEPLVKYDVLLVLGRERLSAEAERTAGTERTTTHKVLVHDNIMQHVSWSRHAG